MTKTKKDSAILKMRCFFIFFEALQSPTLILKVLSIGLFFIFFPYQKVLASEPVVYALRDNVSTGEIGGAGGYKEYSDTISEDTDFLIVPLGVLNRWEYGQLKIYEGGSWINAEEAGGESNEYYSYGTYIYQIDARDKDWLGDTLTYRIYNNAPSGSAWDNFSLLEVDFGSWVYSTSTAVYEQETDPVVDVLKNYNYEGDLGFIIAGVMDTFLTTALTDWYTQDPLEMEILTPNAQSYASYKAYTDAWIVSSADDPFNVYSFPESLYVYQTYLTILFETPTEPTGLAEYFLNDISWCMPDVSNIIEFSFNDYVANYTNTEAGFVGISLFEGYGTSTSYAALKSNLIEVASGTLQNFAPFRDIVPTGKFLCPSEGECYGFQSCESVDKIYTAWIYDIINDATPILYYTRLIGTSSFFESLVNQYAPCDERAICSDTGFLLCLWKKFTCWLLTPSQQSVNYFYSNLEKTKTSFPINHYFEFNDLLIGGATTSATSTNSKISVRVFPLDQRVDVFTSSTMPALIGSSTWEMIRNTLSGALWIIGVAILAISVIFLI